MAQAINNYSKAQAFGRAKSHSKRVRFFKRVLPFIAICGVAFLLTPIIISRLSFGGIVDFTQSVIRDGKLVMSNPNLQGHTSDKRAYKFQADSAVQNLTGDKSMHLETISATMELQGGAVAALKSNSGVFDSDASVLRLPEEAIVTTTDGLTATMGSADVNVDTGDVVATDNVFIESKQSTVKSKDMKIFGGGNHLIFENNVRFVMQPNKAEAKTQ